MLILSGEPRRRDLSLTRYLMSGLPLFHHSRDETYGRQALLREARSLQAAARLVGSVCRRPVPSRSQHGA